MLGFGFSGIEPSLSVTKVLMTYCVITCTFSTVILSTVYDNLFTSFCLLLSAVYAVLYWPVLRKM
jgi:hypothetical protein